MPAADRPEDYIRKRSRECDQSHAPVPAKPAGGTQSKIIHRDGPAPGDPRKTKRNQDEQQGTDGIEVHYRVQADAPQKSGGVIAEHPGGPGVHELMDRDGDDEGDDDRNKSLRIEFPESEHLIRPTKSSL